jgi:hypothetical protein
MAVKVPLSSLVNSFSTEVTTMALSSTKILFDVSLSHRTMPMAKEKPLLLHINQLILPKLKSFSFDHVLRIVFLRNIRISPIYRVIRVSLLKRSSKFACIIKRVIEIVITEAKVPKLVLNVLLLNDYLTCCLYT